jgi:hypothetical protein
MTLFLIEPHEKYKDLDVQHFRCECGATLTDQVPRRLRLTSHGVNKPRRSPSLRQLIKLARQAETAEQFGQLLRRKFARNAERVAGAARDAEDDLIDAQLDALERQLLGDDQ